MPQGLRRVKIGKPRRNPLAHNTLLRNNLNMMVRK